MTFTPNVICRIDNALDLLDFYGFSVRTTAEYRAAKLDMLIQRVVDLLAEVFETSEANADEKAKLFAAIQNKLHELKAHADDEGEND